MRTDTDRALPYVVLLCLVAIVLYRTSAETHIWQGWPPKTDSVPARLLQKELAIKRGDHFKGKGVVLLAMQKDLPGAWPDIFPILYFKHRVALGNDLMNDAEAGGIPMANEYGHWISPPMLALLSAAFYRPEDRIDRAAQALRAFRPNLARLLGVSIVITDKVLPAQPELYRGTALDSPLYIYRIAGANLGHYSPTKTVVATSAEQILNHLQAADFDGSQLAVLERPLARELVTAQRVSVSMHRGPRMRVEAYSSGASLLILPFDYSHCLQVRGQGLEQIMPANLAQVALVVRGEVSLDISYRYGLVTGTACRKQDLERIRLLRLEDAATGRLFHDARSKK